VAGSKAKVGGQGQPIHRLARLSPWVACHEPVNMRTCRAA